MLEYGTQIVAGVTPGKGGHTTLYGRVPVFNTVVEAVGATAANASCIFVRRRSRRTPCSRPPTLAWRWSSASPRGSALDMLRVYHALKAKGVRLIGPNCPGVTTVGEAKVGIIPGNIHAPGRWDSSAAPGR